MARKTTEKAKRDGIKCLRCDQYKPVSKFPKNKYVKNNLGIEMYCADCKKDMINNEDDLINYLKNHGIIFAKETLNVAMSTADKQDWTKKTKEEKWNYTVGRYFAMLNLPQWSPKLIEEEKETSDKFEIETDFKITQDIVKMWGEGYSQYDYERLNDFYYEMMRSYNIETASHLDYLKKICKISLKMDKALDGDDIGNFDKLSKQYDQLMKSAKFTAVQFSASDALGGVTTFSQFFEMVEKNGFIPKFPEVPKDDIDVAILNFINYNREMVGLQSISENDISEVLDYEYDTTDTETSA